MRDLPLLEGEHLEERFIPYDGLVQDSPRKGELLVLTNLRVISFNQSNGHKETLLAPLEELKGITVRANTRGLKAMSQGLILLIAGVLAYFIVGYILENVAIAAALGAAIIFVGVLFIARYFFWEEEGTITFQGGSWDLSFPYKSNMASACVYTLVNRFFQLKLDNNTHRASPGNRVGTSPPVHPPRFPPEGPYFPIA